MHILLTADPYLTVPPRLYGGIERVIAQLIEWLRGHGCEVSLMAHPGSEIAVDRICGWPAMSPASHYDHVRNAASLRRVQRRLQPDVVHSYSRLLYLLALAGKTPAMVMSYQREPTRRTVARSHRLLGPRLRFTGCSEYIARNGRSFGGQWDAIHNFVDCRNLPFAAEVADDAPLVFLSRVESMKGAHLAIDIAQQSGRRLLIAGNHADEGPEAEYFHHQIKPRLGAGIEYVGPVDDQQKGQLLCAAAAMVLPIQWNEPFGIVFPEALACGTPVITCPRGAAPEIIEHGTHGFLINSVTEGVNAVGRIETIQRADCRRRAEDAFDVSAVAPRYLALYRSAVEP